MKLFKNNGGFTLIELMVVVGIIAILLAIAIPNYQKYQAKARQTEAKLNLAAVYTAERAFSVENSSFTTCLREIGVAADGSNTFYVVGFMIGAASTNTCGPRNDGDCKGLGWDTSAAATVAISPCSAGAPTAGTTAGTATSYVPIVASARANSSANFNNVGTMTGTNGSAASVTSSAFNAGAVGNINSSSSTTYDGWTINQNKILSNVVPGL